VVGRAVLDRYTASGGALLAGGLTYSALFALLPALLLLTAILGLVIDDPDRRAAILDSLGRAVPPLRDFLAASMDEIAARASAYGVVGLVGLAWGASRFYAALDDAFARVFSGAPRRGFVARTVRGVVSVAAILSGFLLALALTSVLSLLLEDARNGLGSGPLDARGLLSPALAAAVLVSGTLAVYRLVPARHVTWSAAIPPALVVGVIVAGLTQAFSVVAPRLIGSAALFGAFVAVFAAMVWMSLAFQVLLIGAAWVRERLGPPVPVTPPTEG
jgi:membrane protein